MLAGELKAYDKKVAAGEAQPPPQPAAPQDLPSLAGLHVSAPSQVSQSLPSGGHGFGMIPPKARLRPSMPTIMQLPILELPEPSPQSCSLLDESNLHSQMGADVSDPMQDGDDVGGTCVPSRPLRVAPLATPSGHLLRAPLVEAGSTAT